MFIVYAILTAVIAYTYSSILTDEGMLLSWLYVKLDLLLPIWLFKPIIGCTLCVSGQMALWSFPFFFHYNILHHIAYISLTILTTKLLNKWL